MNEQTLSAGRFRIRLAFVLCVLVLAIQAAPAAHAATITVNTLVDENDHSCIDGDCSLRDAIEVAAAGDTIDFSVTGTSTLTLGQLTINKNLTISGPGAGSLTISGNNASRIFWINSGVNATISSVTIANGSACRGGGIYNDYGTLTVNNSTLSNNSATCDAPSGAGGIYNAGDIYGGGTLTVNNSIFSSNSAVDAGGAIGNGGWLTVRNSTFSSNTAANGGGAIHTGGNAATVNNSTFSGNNALFGGAIYVHPTGGDLTVNNSTFSNNSATTSAGGGICNQGTLNVINSTFSGNSAASSGGGIYNSGIAATLKNTIVADSTAGGNCSGTITDGNGNLVWGDTTCPGINADPKLGALANNGGSTQTMKLGSDSAAIDTAVAANCPSADQRGENRDDYNCDIGAFELKLADSTTVIKAVSGAGTYTFGPTMVKVVISTLGSLSSLTVTRTESNHPNATIGIQTGRYWTLTPTGCGSNDCVFNLTLPHNSLSAPEACKYPGGLGGAGWDCGHTGFNTTTVWRNGLTAFSDWAVGNNVGPTAITLQAFRTRTVDGLVYAGVLLACLLFLGGGLALYLRPVPRR